MLLPALLSLVRYAVLLLALAAPLIMLRLLFVLLIWTASVQPGYAQLVQSYGVKIGPSASNDRGDDPFTSLLDPQYRIGFAVFGFAEWLKVPWFSVVTEAGYVQRGYVLEFEGAPDYDHRIDYLSLSAQLKLIWPLSTVAPYALVGPRLDVYLGGIPDENLASAYAPTAIGGVIGAGIDINGMLPRPIFIEARYNADITNSLPDVPRDAYNVAYDLLVGIRL